MTVEEYARKTGLEVLAMPAPGREVTGGYSFVTETSLHLIDAGGKRFRPLFTLLGGSGLLAYIIAAVIIPKDPMDPVC